MALHWPPYERNPREGTPIHWPGGARVAFWVAPNIEFYEISPPANATRPPWPRPEPDIVNWSWRDYGNRVGSWRCLEVFDRHNIVGSISLNSAMCSRLPEVVTAYLDRGWELFSHGQYNTRYLFGLSQEEETAAIIESCREIEALSGRKVQGFLSPALTYTNTTFESLNRAGLSYTLDLFNADRPAPLNRRYGRMVSVPYQVEINDFHALVAAGMSPEAYLHKFKQHFDQLYEEGAKSGTVVGLPLHPYVIGMPHYIWALDEMLAHVRSYNDVWVTTAGEIADFYLQNCYDEAVGARQSDTEDNHVL
jgi:allantoinase